MSRPSGNDSTFEPPSAEPQLYVPPRPGTPFPRGPPPSSESEREEESQPTEPERIPPGPSSEGSKETCPTGDSGVSVEYQCNDFKSAKKLLHRIRVSNRRAASSTGRRRSRSVNSTMRKSRNAEGYECDQSSIEEQESEYDRAKRERRRLDNAEVIRSPRQGGVHRKEPNHRVVQARQLRPALRASETQSSEYMARTINREVYGHDRGQGGFKPLPSLPPRADYHSLAPMATRPHPGQQQENYGRPFSPITPSFGSVSPPMSPAYGGGPYEQGFADYYGSNGMDHTRGVSSLFSLRGLREALPSLMPGRRTSVYEPPGDVPMMGQRMSSPFPNSYSNASMPNINDLLPHTSHFHRAPIEPPENLNLYLKQAVIPKWDKWMDPEEHETLMIERGRWQTRALWGTGSSAPSVHSGATQGESPTARTKNRLVTSVLGYRDETTGSSERTLKQWMQRKSFFRAIEQVYEKNVPNKPISRENRWGEQIFAVSAEGFDTVGFGDGAAMRAEDAGLLGWVTGCVLKTVTSVLHMLRYNSQSMSFQVLQYSVAPSMRDQHGRSHFTRGGARRENITELPDGCGSLVLVDVQVPLDRAMIFCIRPPWLIGKRELTAFVQARYDWKRDPANALLSNNSQHNLLQASIYDDCVKNHCFFFCVTNLEHWVFGHFDPNFEKCSVSPVVSRKADTPSVLQTLTVWCLRAVDERPRDAEMAAYQETSRSPRSAVGQLPHSSLPPPPPIGGPPGYTHRDTLPGVPEDLSLPRLPHPDRSGEFLQNNYHSRGQSMPVSYIHGPGIYPMYPTGSYLPNGLTGGSMFIPHGSHHTAVTRQHALDDDHMRHRSHRGESTRRDLDRRDESHSHTRHRDSDSERGRGSFRDERDRSYVRSRRDSWLPPQN